MSVHALALASFVYGVDGDRVLGARYTDEGALVVIIDRGTAGCPKYILPPDRVLVELGRRSKAISDELRGTFGSDGVAHNEPADAADTPSAVSEVKYADPPAELVAKVKEMGAREIRKRKKST